MDNWQTRDDAESAEWAEDDRLIDEAWKIAKADGFAVKDVE